MRPGSVKGRIFKGTKSWIHKEFGLQGFDNFLEQLSPSEGELWSCPKLSSMTWYPADLFNNMYNAIMSLWGKHDPDVFKKGAAYVAFNDLSTVMKAFIKLGTPSFVANRFPLLWRHYFNSGIVSITERSANTLSIAMFDTKVYGLGGCIGTMGWTTMALEYAGAKNLIVKQPQCYYHDNDHCIINYQWDNK